MLPGTTGIGVLKQMRASGNKTPVLLLTALGTVEDRVAGLDAGADDYLVKPFDFDELLARVRAIIRRGGERASSVMTSGDLTLDAYPLNQ
jgi:DNA-binding response OmpR family regulator